jgi:hypothetical protein
MQCLSVPNRGLDQGDTNQASQAPRVQSKALALDSIMTSGRPLQQAQMTRLELHPDTQRNKNGQGASNN